MRTVPTRREAFTVFAQDAAPALPVAALVAQAARFFGEQVTVHALGEALPVGVVGARVVVGEAARACFGSLREDADLEAAQAAEARGGYTGMSLLASRCPSVWLVELAPVGAADDDGALLVAAILASVVLGPILSPDGAELFGVKTARAKLGR